MIKPMRCQDFDRKRLKLPCLVSPKIDGMRGEYHDGEMYSKEGHLLKGLDHIAQELASNEPSLDFTGELYIPGMSFEKATGLIRSANPTPQAKFGIIDIPSLNFEYHNRYNVLLSLFKVMDNIFIIPNFMAKTYSQVNVAYKYYVKTGYEGVVIKTLYHRYQPGKKSWDWMRMIPTKYMTLKVVGYYEGKGKYKDMLGGFNCIDDKKKSVNIGTGFTDQQRYVFFRSPEKYMFRNIRVSYARRTSTGSLRHPRFIRFDLESVTS